MFFSHATFQMYLLRMVGKEQLTPYYWPKTERKSVYAFTTR